MRYILLVLALGLGACGGSDPALRQYAERFQQDAKAHGREVSIEVIYINFTDAALEGAVVARCFFPYLQVERNAWQTTQEATREVILYHEMGHCLLGKGHSTNPADVMYPISGWQLDTNRDATLQRLFAP